MKKKREFAGAGQVDVACDTAQGADAVPTNVALATVPPATALPTNTVLATTALPTNAHPATDALPTNVALTTTAQPTNTVLATTALPTNAHPATTALPINAHPATTTQPTNTAPATVPHPAHAQCETLAHGTRVSVSAQHTFGTDALLLAAFCRAKHNDRLCDFCTGCGIIPLRLHDGGHRGTCVAIELLPDAVALLEQSVRENAAQHITPICADLRTWNLPCNADGTRVLFDCITCNPPYFTGGARSKNTAKATARHADMCTVVDVCTAAAPLLHDGGRLCICLPPARLTDALCAMRNAHIEPKRLQFVSTHPQKEPWLFLLEGQKNRAPGLRMLPLLCTHSATQ